MKYIAPEVNLKMFTCPHCDAQAQQNWHETYCSDSFNDITVNTEKVTIAVCFACDKETLWLGEKMLVPDTGNAPSPSFKMPEAVKNLYLEASSISSKSPRGAAALLRLSIQVLMKELGEKGENINDDIASLVKNGLLEEVKKSLDIVRVIGNDAVHPGTIDFDDSKTVGVLFCLVNLIVEQMISTPKNENVDELYEKLSPKKREAIKARDKKAKVNN